MPQTFDLVFRGGGIKGLAFVGALTALTDEKHTTRRLIGTSAGAIFATAWAAGFTPTEMKNRIATRVDGKLAFASFLQDAYRPELVPALLWSSLSKGADSLFRQVAKQIPGVKAEGTTGWGGRSLGLVLGGAVCDDRPFRQWLTIVLAEKKIDASMPLADFHQHINKLRLQQLSLIATDITDQRVLVLNERTAPKLPLIEAVRMSMGIPFVWKEVTWKQAWGQYHGQDIVGHQVVDGGLLSNFPMRYLLEERFRQKDGELGPIDGDARPLGFLLDGQKVMPDLPDIQESTWLVESLPVVRLTSQLLDTLMDSWDRDSLRQYAPGEQEKRYVCRIGTKGIGSLEFDLPDERLSALVNSGHCAMKEFFKV